MYSIRIFDGPDDTKGTLLSSPYVNNLKVKYNMNLVKKGISNADIEIPRTNTVWQSIKPLTTLIEITNIRTFKVVFRGRILRPKHNYQSSGRAYVKYDCEDKRAYLRDSNQRWAVLQNISIRDGLEKVIDVHNGDLEPHQRFKLGNVTVTNSTDNIYGFIGYGDTYSEIKENFIDRFGGYLSVREEPDGTYLDYLADDPPLKNTKISIRGNLREFRRELDPTEIKTRIIPLGARIEPAEGEESYVSMPRIDAKSVNNDKDYFDDEALRQEFGIIVGKLEYDDIHDPQYLPLRADQFFQNQKAAKVSYQVSALQTYLTDNEVDELEVGYRYPVSTAPAFNIEEELEIIAMQISSDRPQRPDLTIGEQYKTLSQYQADANRQRLTVQQLEERISSLGNKNVQLSQSLDEAKSSVTQLKTALQYNDDTGISIALNDIDETLEILKGDLDSIPIATQTSNGLMSITDKIKLDGLQNYSIATEAADGLLSAVDKTKLNKLENYDVVTATTNGLMAAADKTALDKVATGVGDITLLATAEKTDLVLAINELTNRVATLEGGS